MKKAIVLLANGCEEVEAITQIDFLRRGNVEVAAASIHDTTTIQGAHGITIMADCLLKDLTADSYDMVILPGGGPGPGQNPQADRKSPLPGQTVSPQNPFEGGVRF